VAVRRLTDREVDRLYRRYEDAWREVQRLSRGSSRGREHARAERRMLSLERQYRAAMRRRRGSPHRDASRSPRHRHRSASAPTFAKQRAIARKVRILRHEGYPEKQAVAIAYSMAGEARKRDPGSSYHQGTSTSVRHRRLLRAAKEDVRRLVKAKRQGYDVSQELARARAQVAAFNRR
jgi:hypothetical protein